MRAGVHRGLSELAMRALVNDGATASRHESPCTTPEELVKAIGEMPRIRPPEPAFTTPPEYQRTTYQQGTYGRPAPHPGVTQPVPTPPPPLQSRTGKALKWAVSALLIAALGLGSWQLADALIGQGNNADDTDKTQTTDEGDKGGNKPKPAEPLTIQGAQEYVAKGGAQSPGNVANTYDGDSSTYWRTKSFLDGPEMNPAYKPGGHRLRPRDRADSRVVVDRSAVYGRPHHDHSVCDGLGRLVDPDQLHGEARDRDDNR
ncbi:hypothetical protein SHIRM173S_04578 [Streptomyces hirsutus]